MPGYLRGKLRDVLTFVKLSDANLFYGFKTRDLTALTGIGTADVTALGHTPVGSLPPTRIAVIGANSPKPPRVRKVLVARPAANEQGAVSVFCGVTSISSALAEGWQLVNGGRGVSIKNGRSITVGAKLTDGGVYLFPMNSLDVTTYAEALGLILPANMGASDRSKAFTGTSKPKPPIVSKDLTSGSFRSFCSYDAVEDLLSGDSVGGPGYSLVKAEMPSPAPSIPPSTP